MTTQSKFTSTLLLIVAILVVLALYGVERLGIYTLPTRGGVEATIRVAVPPALVDWATLAAQEFMGRNQQIQVEIIALKAPDASDRLGVSSGDVIDAWIGDASFVRADLGNIPFTVQGPSMATDSLIWVGIPQNSAAASGGDWMGVHQAAATDMQFHVALPPTNAVDGAAACLSAAAAFHNSPTLTNGQISDPAFRTWVKDVLEAAPNPGLSARSQLANRPPQAHIGLVRVSEWTQLDQSRFESNPPSFNVRFDFPYLVRTNWPALSDNQANGQQVGAERFRDFLLERGQQRALTGYGLAAAESEIPGELVQADRVSLSLLYGCWR